MSSLIFVLLICLVLIAKVKSESDDILNSEFLSWFNSNGGKSPSIGLKTFDGMGRGIEVLKNINSNDEIIRIPNKLIFSTRDLGNSNDKIHQQFSLLLSKDKDGGEESIIAALLLEKQRGIKSFFKPYIDILPKYVSNLIHFNEEELKELQNPEFENDAMNSQKKVNLSFQTFLKIAPSVWPNDLNINDITLQDYHWASSIVDSRGLRFRGQVYLAPLADMFNYAPHSDRRESSAGEFYLKHHQLGDEELVILADRAQSKGTQLPEDYGDNSDQIYLQYHGFVPEYNPFRCVSLTAPRMSTLPEHTVKLVKALQFKNVPSKCVDSTGALGNGLEIFMSAIAFNEDESNICIDKIEKMIKKADKKKNARDWQSVLESCGFNNISKHLDQISKSQEVINVDDDSLIFRATKTIQQWIYQSRPKFLTTLEEDELILSTIEKDPVFNVKNLHQSLATKYRLYIKKIWNHLIKINGGETSKEALISNSKTILVGGDYFNDTNEIQIPLEQKIDEFNKWFDASSPSVNRIIAKVMPFYRIGTIARDDIKFKETYLGVPTSVIMDATSARSDPLFGSLLQQLDNKYKNKDDFHELLFFLCHERLVRREKSFYWSYLRLLPTPNEMINPSLWTDEDIKSRLGPSNLADEMIEYNAKTRSKFDFIKTVDIIKDFFPENFLTFEVYRWATTILDSRSIWWDGKRHLVPMLDFINCIQGPDPYSIHSTKTDDNKEFAITNAAWDFKEGEQLFENYGQPNHIYYQYHGFILEENVHDCVNFPIGIDNDEGEAVDWIKAKDIVQRLRLRGVAAFSTCLTYPFPDNVWLFLSLKMNTFEELRAKKQLGVPTFEGVTKLISLMDERITKYETHVDNTR